VPLLQLCSAFCYSEEQQLFSFTPLANRSPNFPHTELFEVQIEFWFYLCVCVCVCLCARALVGMCVCMCIRTSLCICMCICTYVFMWLFKHFCLHLCTHVFLCMYLRTYACMCVCVYVCMYVTLIRFSRYCIAFGDDMAPFALRINFSITKRDSKWGFMSFPKLNRNLSVVKKILKVWHCKGMIIQWVGSATKSCSGGRRSLGFWGGTGSGPSDIAYFTFPYDSDYTL
jgi:hypothetical protein